jgi:NAD(P)-dependent dehydrogenase (short-subunit alcohol dehydrogenase family)
MAGKTREGIPDPAALFRLDGRVALVTGAGSGIGHMAAHVLARAGAFAVATDVNADTAEATAAEIRADGYQAAAYAMDVTDEAAVARIFAAVKAAHGSVGVLINNAGASGRSPTEDLPLEVWDRVIAVNLTGVMLCAREAGRQMLAEGRGSIVNISSMWGHVGGPFNGNAAYHASKGAVVNLTRALAVEWGKRGIRVNDIAPTFLVTGMTNHLFGDQEFLDNARTFTPLGRTGTPDDLAGALLYLASDASSLVTGLSVKVDGGWTAR